MTRVGVRTLFVSLGLAVCILASATRAATVAVTTPSSITTATEQVLIGYKFKPLEDMYVTALGVWDGNTAGLLTDNAVGVYDSAGNLLFSATVQAGTVDPLVVDYRYAAIGPQLLLQGQEYQIFSIADGADEYYGGDTPGVNGITLTSGGLYSYVPTSLPASLPSLLDFGYDIYGGPNFQFEPVPEPSSALMLASAAVAGFVGLGVRRFRRTP